MFCLILNALERSRTFYIFYHEAAEIGFMESRSGGFNYTLLEMLSIGKHCLVSYIAGHQWSEKYKTDIFYPANDLSAAAKASNSTIYSDLEPSEDVVARQILHIIP